jgi:hypothetical protein
MSDCIDRLADTVAAEVPNIDVTVENYGSRLRSTTLTYRFDQTEQVHIFEYRRNAPPTTATTWKSPAIHRAIRKCGSAPSDAITKGRVFKIMELVALVLRRGSAFALRDSAARGSVLGDIGARPAGLDGPDKRGHSLGGNHAVPGADAVAAAHVLLLPTV